MDTVGLLGLNTVEFLEEVIRRTSVTITYAELERDREWIEKLPTSEGLNIVQGYARTNSLVMRDFASRTLADYGGFVRSEEEKYEARREDYNKSTIAFQEFKREHGAAIEYIAALADGKEVIESPEENPVFITLTTLQGIGCVDFADPEGGLEVTLALYSIVKTASHEHAKRTGRDPDEYFGRVAAGTSSSIVVL